MSTESKKQQDKEKAVLLALQKDMALIRRELKVFGLKKDGSETLISESNNYESLWADALTNLKKTYE